MVYKSQTNLERIRYKLIENAETDSDTGCWNWVKSLFGDGYGTFNYLGETRAHRVAYRLYNGDIPEGVLVCHSCDNPKCVNPAHLFLGSHLTNAQDRTRKGRGNCPKGDDHFSRHQPERVARGDRHKSITKPESVVKGVEHHNVVLTEAEVLEIRANPNKLSQYALAALYGVARATVQNVIERTTWKHL